MSNPFTTSKHLERIGRQSVAAHFEPAVAPSAPATTSTAPAVAPSAPAAARSTLLVAFVVLAASVALLVLLATARPAYALDLVAASDGAALQQEPAAEIAGDQGEAQQEEEVFELDPAAIAAIRLAEEENAQAKREADQHYNDSLKAAKKVFAKIKKDTKKNKRMSGKWKASGGYVYYVRGTGKKAKGLVTIKNKTYLFDIKGRQKTGWQYYKGSYRFFKPVNKSGGYMVKNKVVNGIKLKKDGTATVTATGSEELSIMVKAQKLKEQLTKPTQSKAKKLASGFAWMRDDCIERARRDWSYYSGWHRDFALDIIDYNTGSCYSFGAAFAYYANAVGCKSCKVVSSGGHGWAEVDGAVYDVEWTRQTGRSYFAFPYSSSGGGAPNYAANRTYVVSIAPHKSRW